MKKITIWSVTILMSAAAIVSCSDKDSGVINPIDDGVGNVQLRIYDGTRTKATSATETPTTAENALATTLSVFVYDDQGVLEYANMALGYDPQTQLTSRFQLSEGLKKFYLFSNGLVTMPATGSTADKLETQEIFVDFDKDASGKDFPSPMARAGAMSIGTLWKTDRLWNIEKLGGDPVQVEIEIGRAAAKITLETVNKGTSPLFGTFTDPIYRLRSVGVGYYLVGQFSSGGTYPPTESVRYVSLLDDEPPVASGNVQKDRFYDYDWMPQRASGVNNLGESYYAVENTTLRQKNPNDTEEHLYYGNTTYIQMGIVYTPASGDPVYLADNTAYTAFPIAEGTTFWTAMYDDGTGNVTRRIYMEDPATTTGIVPGSEIKEYENGVMYYKFAVKDDTESMMERKYCVIRNHSYRVAVNNITDLGEPTDVVDPWEPIEDDKEANVEITVKILDWFLVTQNQDL